MATKIVGLDLGTHTVKVCELVTAFRNFELVGFGYEPVEVEGEARPDFEALAAAARRLLERRGLLGETLMCALPPGMAATATVELPFDQPKKIEAVLPMQLDDLLPVPVDEVVYDYQVTARREDGGSTVLIAYVRRDRFAELLAALELQGIDPKVVGIGPLSIYNLYDHAIGAETQAPVAMLDLGHGHSELSVFDRGEPQIVRDIAGGGLQITLALAAAFHVEPAQAERGKISEGFVAPAGQEDTEVDIEPETATSRRRLVAETCRRALGPVVREVRRSLVAHEMKTGRAVERLYLTGGTSLLSGLPEYLEHELKVAVMPLDPLRVGFNKLADSGERVRPFVAKALANSLRAFSRAHQSQVNFRKGDFAYTGDFGFLQGRVITLAVAALLMIMLGSLVALTKKQRLEAEYAAIKARVSAISQPILGYETDDVDALYNTVVASDRTSANPIPEYDALQMLAQISEKIPFDLEVDLDVLDINLENKRMQLQGKTTSGGDVERIVEALRATPCFRGEINKERVEKSVDDKTKFRLTATATCI